MFIPRQPVVENQFCIYGEQTDTGSAGVGGVVAYAGSVVYMDSDNSAQDSIVYRYDTFANKPTVASELKPIGFLMQKVKTGYHQVLPVAAMLPGDQGSSDAIAQPTYDSSGNITGTKTVPVGVAHLGIWDTVHYVCAHTSNTVATGDNMKPGDDLYVACNNGSRVTNVSDVATDDTLDYEALMNVVVGRVIKGASAAKCSANIANTVLYPIRIKIII